MSRVLVVALILSLAACAAPQGGGKISDMRVPQEREQCEAQPELDWCPR